MSGEGRALTILKSSAVIATLVLGFICQVIGIYMLYKGTVTVTTIGKVSFSASLVLLIIGLVLIMAALARLFSKTSGQNPAKPWLLLLGIVFLGVFIGTHYEFAPGDKYRILCDLILILVGLSTLMGYGVFKWISREVGERVEKERHLIEEGQVLTRATIARHVGFAFWLLFDAEKKKNTSDLKELEYRKQLLKRAIEQTKLSLEIAQQLPKTENKYKREIHLCMNNWIYYLAETMKVEGLPITDDDKMQALNWAKELLTEATKQIYPANFYRFQESCAWALFHLSKEDDSVSKQKARDIYYELQNDVFIPSDWREEIKSNWEKFLEPR